MESNIIGVVIADLDGRIRSGNGAFLEMLGLTRANLAAGLRWHSLIPPVWRATDKRLRARLRRDGFSPPVEMELLHTDQRRVPIRAAMTRLGEPGEACLCLIEDMTEVAEAHAEAQHLTRRLMQTQERERLQLARELHDQVGQSLTALRLQLDAVASPQSRPTRLRLARDAKAVVDELLERVQELSLNLRPPLLDQLGLVAALRGCLRTFRRSSGLVTRLEADPQPPELPAEVASASFRIAQEALTNVVRHACATSVSLVVRFRAGGLDLRVCDDGQGFDLARLRGGPGRRDCLGLLGMEERASLVGGTLQIRSSPGRGTKVHARLPITHRPEQPTNSHI